MSGKIKTGASTWSTASEMRVKTSSSNWAVVSKAYIKTAANTWSQWFIAPIKDTFTRATSGNLSNADTGQLWETISGTWFSNGSQAQTNDAANTHPISRINYGDQNAVVSATPTSGTGPAIWVSSSGDWYAAVLFEDQITQLQSCNCYCNSGTEFSPIYGYQSSGCPPCSTTYSNQTYTGTPQNFPYLNYVGEAQLSCSGYYYLYQGVCHSVGNFYDTQAPYQTCSSGTIIGSSCYTIENSVGYVCDDGSVTSGTNQCSRQVATCNSPCNYGIVGWQPYSVSGGTYPNCSYGSTCSQCQVPVPRYFLRLLKSVGGSVTTVGADILIGSVPAKIKLEASNGAITYTAYSDMSMSSILGSGTHTPTTPVVNGYYGIVKSPSTYNQGSTVDNFSVSG